MVQGSVSQNESDRPTDWRPLLRRRLVTLLCAFLSFCSLILAGLDKALAVESYAIAMHGAPALPATFDHMPYANPDAPKGGRLVQGLLGTFDSLNPLIVRGIAVQEVRGLGFERGY